MPTPAIQTLINDAQQVLNLDSISAVRSVVAVSLANANTGTPLNPNLTTQQLWNEFYQVVTRSKSDIESIIANQLMKFLYSPPAPGGVGADKQVIFNDGGVLAGDPQFLWDKTTNLLTVTGSATISGDLTVDTSTLKVDSANNQVGIGTATPGGALEVFKNTNGQNRLFLNNPSTGTGAYDAIDFTAGTANNQILSMGSGYSGSFPYLTGALLLRSAQANGIVLNTAGSAAAIQFGINDTLGMTLNATGLGVGVSPSYNIHARGTTNGRIQVEGASGFGMVFIQGSSGNTAQLQLNSSGGTGRRFNLYSDPTGFFGISDETAVLTRFIIDASGNVGIGVTPSAWASIYKTVEFANGSSIWGQTDIPQLSLQTNAFLNSSFQWIYKTAAAASNYRQTAGEHLWFTAPSGTAGNVITFTERLRLKETGQLRFVPLAADPAGAEAGDVYYNSTSNKLKCYNGTTWNDLF